MSKDVETYYCPIHGDLLAAPRSMRCHEAPEGHEFSRATVPDVAQGGRDYREAVEAVIDVLMGLPVQVRRDTTALAEALVAGLPALSRATAPDVATESAAKYIRVQTKANARLRRLANKTIRDTETERDAALAAVESVKRLLAPMRDRLSEYGEVPLRHAVSKTLEFIAALDGAPEPDDEPCTVEINSWDRRAFRPEQIDHYWIRCTALGKHDEHEDSNTGLKWRSGLPVEGESKP